MTEAEVEAEGGTLASVIVFGCLLFAVGMLDGEPMKKTKMIPATATAVLI